MNDETNRAAPAAAQLDADSLPPPLTEEQILAALGSITHEAPKRLPPGWLNFARAIEAEIVAPYAERIRLLTEELATFKAEHATLRAGEMVRDLVKLWDSGFVSADEYNEAMCAIEDRMRAYAAAPSLSGTEEAK